MKQTQGGQVAGRGRVNNPMDAAPLEVFSEDSVREFEPMRLPIVADLLRQGETMNIVAPSKAKKSWLVMDLAIAVATGGEWLNRKCTQGGVLVLDLELHRETFHNRVREVADARGVLRQRRSWGTRLGARLLRGTDCDINALAECERELWWIDEETMPSVIIIDALYRVLPKGCNENDNGAMTSVYNAVDRIANKTGAAVVIVHHTSKGGQSGKNVGDVGSGAGAITRCPDVHVILREHAQPGLVVAEAIRRSGHDVSAQSLRWDFPRWTVAAGVAPVVRTEKPSADRSAAGVVKDAAWLVETCVAPGVQSRDAIIARAIENGCPESVAMRLFRLAVGEERIFKQRKAAAISEYATTRPAGTKDGLCV